MTVLYRDVDRTPYLYTLMHTAAERGLTIELVRGSMTRFAEVLAAGEVDVLSENYWGLQGWRARGFPFVSVATAVTRLNETLLVHPEIESIRDLKGRRFAIRGLGPSELIAKLWLRDTGLSQETEGIVYSEGEVGRWGNWKKVVDGVCHGCFVTNLYADEAIAAGLKPLEMESYGFIGNVTLTTTQALIERRPEALDALVHAAFDASALFRNDRSAALEIMRSGPQRMMNEEQQSAGDLERTYEILSAELSEYPVPTPEGLSNTRRMSMSVFPELTDFNPLGMWDLSIARKAGLP